MARCNINKGIESVGNQARHILVLRLSAWGDIVQCSGAVRFLLSQGHRVTICIKPAFADFVRRFLPDVEILTYDRQQGEKEARNLVCSFVREQEVAAVLDLHDTVRTKIIRWILLRETPFFVARKPRLQEFFIYVLRLGFLFGLGRGGRAKRFINAAKRAQEYLQGIDAGELRSTADDVSVDDIPLTALDRPEVTKLQERFGLPKRYIALAPGGAWLGKRWSADKFTTIAKTLAARLPIVVLGAETDTWCEQIANAAKAVNSKSISLAGKCNITESGTVASHATIVVGNDTGLVHVAEACGAPTVMVEGPTHPSLGYSTYRETSVVVGVDLLCRPCSKNGRICWRMGTRACMDRVNVDSVLIAIHDLLER